MMNLVLDNPNFGTKEEIFKKTTEVLDKLFIKNKLKKILFVLPPDFDENNFNYDVAKRGRYSNFPPYGVGLLSTHLINNGCEAKIINLNNEILKNCRKSKSKKEFNFSKTWKDYLVNEIIKYQPDLISLTCMFSKTNESTKQVCKKIKFNFPTIPVGLGGVHITNSLENEISKKIILEDFSCVDLFFTHEGEKSLIDFVKIVNKKISVEKISQTVIKYDLKHLTFKNINRPEAHELNILPSYQLMQIEELSDWGSVGAFGFLKEQKAKIATVLANRGCRARCTFCSVRNFNGLSVRTRSVESVIEELKKLKFEYNINHIMWLDDDFLYNKPKSIKLFNEIVKNNLDISWECSNGVISASCTDEVISASQDSGCIGMILGMESGNKKILKDIKKPGTPETFLRAAEVMKKYEKIHSRVFLMIGFPRETYRMILDTIDVAKTMDQDWYVISPLQPLPNTPIFDTMFEEGLIEEYNPNEIAYNSGTHSKASKKAEKGKNLLSQDFKDAFKLENLDKLPTREDLDNIWAYMNFHLNFRGLDKELRKEKLNQQRLYIEYIHNMIDKDNAFVLYYNAKLQKRIDGSANQNTLSKLNNVLNKSVYWKQRFRDFNLKLTDFN